MSTDLTTWLWVTAVCLSIWWVGYHVHRWAMEYLRHSRNVAEITGREWQPSRGDR